MHYMDFSEALSEIRAGKRVAREGWNGKGMYIFLIDSGMYESNRFLMGVPIHAYIEDFICMYTADKKYVPWLASQTDLLAEDWMTVVQ